MRYVFDALTRLSLRFRAVTIAIVLLVIALGISAGSQLKQELLPPVEFPQTIILAQASGMTSEQVLTVLTSRIEEAVQEIPEIVNVDSQTTGAFGAFITASNDFGLNQQRLQTEIRAALDVVWLPSREIAAPDGEAPDVFASRLIADLEDQHLLYLASQNPAFLFQLSPAFWQSLNEDTLISVLAYLAEQRQTPSSGQSALQALVEQEIVPQLDALAIIGNVTVSGGQSLPGEENGLQVLAEAAEGLSLLYQITPEVWEVITARLPEYALNDASIEALSELPYNVPAITPSLPESWQMSSFRTSADLAEMGSATRNLAGVMNDFLETGRIKGSINQTDDLTPEIMTRMLSIEPSMIEYFDAQQIASLPAETFAVLPADFVSSLDGFTRDELAASVFAERITGEIVSPDPVNLPAAWRLQPPQLLTFSFGDLPLATFSIFSTAEADANSSHSQVGGSVTANTEAVASSEVAATDAAGEDVASEPFVEEGPTLPALYGLIGQIFGAQLDTADDLLQISLSGDFAELTGSDTLSAAEFFNSLLLFSDPAALGAGAGQGEGAALPEIDLTAFVPALAECGVGLLNITSGNLNLAETIIGCLSAEAVSFVVANDPGFNGALQATVFDYFSDEVLLIDGIAPPLGDVWSTLASKPQFRELPLRSADDLLLIGGGSVADLLNTLNAAAQDTFGGYEIRLIDSLTPTLLRYFALYEADFYASLDVPVLLDFSAQSILTIPQEVLDGLPADVSSQLAAIASGEQGSAAAQLAELYVTNTIPADPDAPVLNPAWQFIGGFLGIELNNAFDLFRFPDVTGTPSQFVNGLFNSPGGAGLAPDLLGNLSQEAFDYIAAQDSAFVSELSADALVLLSGDVFASLPDAIQERAETGEVFLPSTQITRTNGSSSLLVTVFKTSDANTVEAFYAVKEIIERLDAENPNIAVQVAFEQSSFIETSISGVIREGTLGAFFAIINILVFLSGGLWGMRGRRIVGVVVIIVSVLFLSLLVALNMDAAGGSIELAFNQADVLLRFLGFMGIIAGILIIVWAGKLPYPSWRSTLVIGVSIPLSILSALALMRWLPPFINEIFGPLAETSPIAQFILRLAPLNLTLNIMTLSGLTVAVGRVVDDSIVVLENIFRQIQTGMDKREAILTGVRDVSVAIFSATGIAVVVFLPLGLTGGLIGEFFLPFGLAVTYALLASFVVAITVIPVLAYTFISEKDVPEESETWMQRLYVPILQWVLASRVTRWGVVVAALVSVVFSVTLFAARPAAFLPDFGEPQITVDVSLPTGTRIVETNELVRQLETAILTELADEVLTVRSSVGGGGLNLDALIGGGGVTESAANITISVVSNGQLDAVTLRVREIAEEIFGEEAASVSAGSLTSSGGFGGFELVVSGADQDMLAELDPQIIAALSDVEGITNVSSNLADAGTEGASITYIRSNGVPALSYTGELTTQDTIGVTSRAVEAIQGSVVLPEGVTVGQGFDSQIQTEGFASIFVAMGIAVVIVVAILIIVFGSPVYWLAIIFSIVVAPVGAAIALTLTDRVLGISALIGMLMLLGLVVTNAIVLIDRVGSNRVERGMSLYDALVEAGGRRVRPILMTALATIIALIPLALGLSEGAIIAAELGTVVIGGVLSSTLLTLIVVPAAYYVLTPVNEAFLRVVGRKKSTDQS